MERYCQSCYFRWGDVTSDSCTDKELQYLAGTVPGTGVFPEDGVLEQPPTPPPGPFVPPQGGVLQQTPGEGGGLQPPTRGQGVLPPVDQGSPETPTGEEAKAPFPGSPTGGCVSTIRTHCVPCDPGIPGASCTPSGEWPPVLSTDTGIPQTRAPPTGPLVGEIAPETEQPPASDETQPATTGEEPVPPCPEGQVLDEETGLCVLEQPEEQPQEEQAEQQPAEGDSSEENTGGN
jgi:hypothetical protein